MKIQSFLKNLARSDSKENLFYQKNMYNYFLKQ